MQRIVRCVLGMGLLFGALFLAPVMAQAVTTCDLTIVDDAGVLDDAQISAAAKKLEDLGAIVRVRSFDTAPMGSLDAYREEQVRTCSSWRGIDGQPAGRLAVFTFTVTDRKSNICTGSDWASQMDSQVNRIRNQVMNPKLGNKKYTDGVVAAMDETSRAISGSAPVSEPVDTGSGISRTAVMWIIYIVGGLLLAGALIVVALVWHRRVVQRREAQADAVAAFNQATDALSKIDQSRTEMTGVLVDKATMGLEEKMTDALRQSFQGANALVTAAYEANGPLSDKSAAMNPTGKHSRQEYDAIAEANADVAAKAAKAAAALDAIELNCGKIEQMVATMDSAAVELRKQATALVDRKGKLLEQDYKVSLDDQFAELDQNITAVFNFTEANTPGQALDERARAEALVVEIDQQLTWLSKIRGDLQNRHQQLNERRLELSGDTGVAAKTYERLEEDYNPVLFQNVKPLVPENNSSLKEMAQLLDLAVAAMDMAAQDWGRATDLLNEVSDLCDRVKENCTTVSACERELAQLAVRTLSDADALSGKISQAQRTVATYKGNQYGYSSSLGDLSDDAVRLREQVRRHKPDYRTLAQECKGLEAEISSILSSARNEHQRVLDEERRERERLAAAERARVASLNTSSSYSSGGGGGYDGGSNSSGSY